MALKEPMARSTYLHLMQGMGADQARLEEAGKDSKLEMVSEYTVSAGMNVVLQRAEYRPASLLAPVDAKGVNDVGVRSFAVRLQPKTVD